MDGESLYLQLGQLLSEAPDLANGPINAEMNRWLGRAAALVRAARNPIDEAVITVAADNLNTSLREQNAQQVMSVLYRTLAYAELNAPTSARGGFIGVGAALDALQVVGKVLAGAQHDVLIIDAYMDSKVVTDFAPSAAENVTVRLLADASATRPEALVPSITRWHQQFTGRPALQARLSPRRALHDRLVILDGSQAWSLTQSLKDFANRSPALVQKIDAGLVPLKVEFYESIWAASSVIA